MSEFVSENLSWDQLMLQSVNTVSNAMQEGEKKGLLTAETQLKFAELVLMDFKVTAMLKMADRADMWVGDLLAMLEQKG